MNDLLRLRLTARLARVEGRRHLMYRDSRGIETIGIGHNLRDVPISDRAVDVIFEDDLNAVERAVETALPWTSALSLPRLGVLYEMVFNLGLGGLLEFKKMLAALEAEQWEEAAREIVDSDAAVQTGGKRYQELAEQMRSDKWQT